MHHCLRGTGTVTGRRQRKTAGKAPGAAARRPAPAATVAIRPARRGDIDPVIALDATVTGVEKRPYWLSVFRRYGEGRSTGRQFLVAEREGRVVGFVIGEIRDWEFGSPPCGWVFAIDVLPQARQAGVGTRLLTAICAGFRRAGVTTVRTMLSRDNTLILSFFRSQGLMAGPLMSLERDIGS